MWSCPVMHLNPMTSIFRLSRSPPSCPHPLLPHPLVTFHIPPVSQSLPGVMAGGGLGRRADPNLRKMVTGKVQRRKEEVVGKGVAWGRGT